METILLVDDEAQVRNLARDILVGAGYRVLEAEDGESALRIAEEHSGAIHVVLTDVMMPGINGKQLGDRLLALRPDIKTIFMSGRADEVISDAGVLIPVVPPTAGRGMAAIAAVGRPSDEVIAEAAPVRSRHRPEGRDQRGDGGLPPGVPAGRGRGGRRDV